MSTHADDRADRDSVRLVLDLDLATEAPSGRLIDERGAATSFFGWLQLMDGLEDARERAAEAERTERPSGGGGARSSA